MRKLLLLPCLLVSQSLFANTQIWTDLNPLSQYRQSSDVKSDHKKRHLALDLSGLAKQLKTLSTQNLAHSYLELPLPDGQLMPFKVERSQVMNVKLAQRYPAIKTWKITHPSNPIISGRIDLTPSGFHGMIVTHEGERIFIDPNRQSGDNHYISRNSRPSKQETTHFNCQSHHDTSSIFPNFTPKSANKSLSSPMDSLRTYRIAIATTGEYAQLLGGRDQALSTVVSTVNRLNQVFERDLNIHLELVADNDKILYTSPSSDPYTNEDATAMIDENIININAIIGKDNYDIGHVFGTGGTGGLAFIKSVCGTYKAGGVTGSNQPSDDVFNIDYVAHEIGHQLGASHTFNGRQINCSAGNREKNTAVEPGSGSSIMGYAGICGTDNLQANSDAFFHSVSIQQIKAYTRDESGANCGTLSTQNNNNPAVSAGADHTIPAETPFKLTGTSSDVDEDPMLHSWEQTDTGSIGGLYTDLGDNPLFRAWFPVANTTRYFPRLVDTLNNTKTIGEQLPSTDRQLNFTLLTRDNKGGIAQDSMVLDVVNTGTPFAVLSQNTPTTLSAKQSLSVEWDVANTTAPPIACTHVSIGLLDKTGTTTMLMPRTENDGEQALVMPNKIVSIQNAHIQVSCLNNVFFAVSDGKINVLGGDPVVSVNAPSITEEDTGIRYLTFILSLSIIAEENISIDYEVTDSATSAMLQKGQARISQGDNTTRIQVPVAGDTLHEKNQVLTLLLRKPANAQFANESSELISRGTIIDDDVVTLAASPEIKTSAPSSDIGGGSFSLFSILGLLLLAIRRKITLRIQ